jgi:phage/plasmid-associated DNA primase
MSNIYQDLAEAVDQDNINGKPSFVTSLDGIERPWVIPQDSMSEIWIKYMSYLYGYGKIRADHTMNIQEVVGDTRPLSAYFVFTFHLPNDKKYVDEDSSDSEEEDRDRVSLKGSSGKGVKIKVSDDESGGESRSDRDTRGSSKRAPSKLREDDFIPRDLSTALVCCARKIIIRSYSVSQEQQLVCLYSQSKPEIIRDRTNSRTEDDKVMIKIRFVFPKIRCNYKEQEEHFISHLRKKLSQDGILSKFKNSPIKTWDDIIIYDPKSKHYPIYGARDGYGKNVLTHRDVFISASYDDNDYQKNRLIPEQDSDYRDEMHGHSDSSNRADSAEQEDDEDEDEDENEDDEDDGSHPRSHQSHSRRHESRGSEDRDASHTPHRSTSRSSDRSSSNIRSTTRSSSVVPSIRANVKSRATYRTKKGRTHTSDDLEDCDDEAYNVDDYGRRTEKYNREKVHKIKVTKRGDAQSFKIKISNRALKSAQLTKHFRLQDHSGFSSGVFDSGRFRDLSSDADYYLPLYYSHNYTQFITLLKREIRMNRRREKESEDELKNDRPDFVIARTLIPYIAPEHYLFENTWLDIGRSVYASCDGDPRGADLWAKYSINALRKSGKEGPNKPEFFKSYDTVEEVCAFYYSNNFYNTGITVKTIAWLAKISEPVKYQSWHNKWCGDSFDNAQSCADSDVSFAFYNCYWLELTYCSVNKKWFRFENHRWIECKEGLSVKRTISEQFLRAFDRLRRATMDAKERTNDETERDKYEAKIKKMTRLISSLKAGFVKTKILSDLRERFENAMFNGLIDSSPNLTGVFNGVIEVSGRDIRFREGRPEDFITKCTGISFIEDYTESHVLVRQLNTWFDQLFPDKELKHYFLKFMASGFIAGNVDKILPFFTGRGNNGKSMLVKLFESTYGAYCAKLPQSILTGRATQASSATPELARTKGTRWNFIEEIDDNKPMEKDLIKRATGMDTFYARGLHQDGEEIKSSAKTIIVCNDPPRFANPDQAIQERTRMFPFLATYSYTAPDSIEEQFKTRTFKRDRNFEKKINFLPAAALWMAFKTWPAYMDEGLGKEMEPKIVNQVTLEYWEKYDTYAQFVGENIVRDKDGELTLNDAYDTFKEWFKETFPGEKIPQKIVVRTKLTDKWGKPRNMIWSGMRLKEADDTAENRQESDSESEDESPKRSSVRGSSVKRSSVKRTTSTGKRTTSAVKRKTSTEKRTTSTAKSKKAAESDTESDSSDSGSSEEEVKVGTRKIIINKTRDDSEKVRQLSSVGRSEDRSQGRSQGKSGNKVTGDRKIVSRSRRFESSSVSASESASETVSTSEDKSASGANGTPSDTGEIRIDSINDNAER